MNYTFLKINFSVKFIFSDNNVKINDKKSENLKLNVNLLYMKYLPLKFRQLREYLLVSH